MATSLDDYRSLSFFHKERHIERFCDYRQVLADLEKSDPETVRYIKRFHQAEADLKFAQDMLTHRLDSVINAKENEETDATKQP